MCWNNGEMILRYEDECRAQLTEAGAQFVRSLRVEQAETWRGVGSALIKEWDLSFGIGDTQSLGATMCHVAAELLAEDPDGEPWN